MATTADCAVVATVFPSLNVTGSCCNSSLPITCDGGRVTRLSFGSRSLAGTLSPALGSLTELTYLDLGSNALTGALPSSIGRLTKLTYLEVSSNSLSGPLPESLGSLASLTELSLDRNAFSGPIPESFGKLTKLIKLSMYNNRLSGNLPSSLGNLRKLDVLYLDNNTLAGPIGPVTSLTELSSLGLSYNQFSDSVKQLKKLTKLGSVWLESNLQLTGDFPSTVSPATHCSMSDTDICTSSATLQKACNVPACPTSKSCTIPVEAFPTLDFGDNCCTSGYVTCNNSQITAVSLSGANLRGSLPSSLGDLRSITSLDLSSNPQLTGPLPSAMPRVSSCNLSGTGLCSTGDAPPACNAPSCTAGGSANVGLIAGIAAAVLIVTIAAAVTLLWCRMRGQQSVHKPSPDSATSATPDPLLPLPAAAARSTSSHGAQLIEKSSMQPRQEPAVLFEQAPPPVYAQKSSTARLIERPDGSSQPASLAVSRVASRSR